MKPLPLIPRGLPTLHLPYPNLPAHSGSSIGTHITEVLRYDEATRPPPHIRKTTPPVVKGYIPPELRPVPPVGYVRSAPVAGAGIGPKAGEAECGMVGMNGSIDGNQVWSAEHLEMDGRLCESRRDSAQISTCSSMGFDGSQLNLPSTAHEGSTWSVSDTTEINQDFYQVADPTIYRLDPVPVQTHLISQYTSTTYTYSTIPRAFPAPVVLESPLVSDWDTRDPGYVFPPGPNGLAHPPFPAVYQPHPPLQPSTISTQAPQPIQPTPFLPYVPSQVRPNPSVQLGTILPPQLYHAPFRAVPLNPPPQAYPGPFFPLAKPQGQGRRSRIPTPIIIPSQSRPPTRAYQRGQTNEISTLAPFPDTPLTLPPTSHLNEPFTPYLITPQEPTFAYPAISQLQPNSSALNNLANPLCGLGAFGEGKIGGVSAFGSQNGAGTTHGQPFIWTGSDCNVSSCNIDLPSGHPTVQHDFGTFPEPRTFSVTGNSLFISPSTTEFSFDPAMLNFSSFSEIYPEPTLENSIKPALVPVLPQPSLQSSYLLSPDQIPPTPLTSVPIFQSSLEQTLHAISPAQTGTTPAASDLTSAASSRSGSTPHPVTSGETGSPRSSRTDTRGRAMFSRPSRKRTSDVMVLTKADVSDTGIERFPCEAEGCQATFTRPSDMLRHKQRLHVPYAEWRYVCGDCDVRFSRKDHLMKHMRGHCSVKWAEEVEREISGQA